MDVYSQSLKPSLRARLYAANGWLLSLFGAVLAIFLLIFVPQIARSQGYATYASVATNSANFTAGGVTGTIAISNRTNLTAASGLLATTPPVGSNFPSSWYSPITPAIGNFQRYELSNSASTGVGSYRVTYNFTTPVTNPVLNFYNVDSGTYNFALTTQVGGGAVALSKLSGNNALEVSGNVVNSTPATAVNTGCEANDGTNGTGGCGSVQLTGIYTSIVFVGTDTTTATTTGDGHAIGLYVQSDYGDAPASYGTAAHSGSTAIRLGALRDVEGADQPSTGATLDDTSGTDDEDAISAVTTVTAAPGGAHIQAGIACTGTASMYGYIDFNRDGDFADTNERSAVTTCGGGTAALSWTLPTAVGSLVPGSSFMRIRYGSTNAQVNVPTGNATTGEVEDYPITLNYPSADLSITKTDGLSASTQNSVATYTITVTNSGSSAVTGAVLTDAAATGLTKSAVICGTVPGQCTAGTTPTLAQLEAGYALPALAPGQTYQLRLWAQVTAASGSVANTATIAVPATLVDSNLSDNSQTDTNTVSVRSAGTAPTISCPVGSSTFNWGVNSWTAGSLNNTYNLAGVGNFNIAMSSTIPYLAGSPAINGNLTGGVAGEVSLYQNLNNNAQSDIATTVITMPGGLPGMQFKIFDVDFNANQFADRVTVTGSYNGSPVIPVLTNGTANYVNSNVVIGDTPASDTSAAGNVSVTFNAAVDTVTVVYTNHSTAPTNPGNQWIGLGDLTFCNPYTSYTIAKISQVLSDGVSATNPKSIPGATVQYCITFGNTGTSAMTGVVATDNLPTGVSFVSGSMRSGTSCGTATTVEDDDASDAGETDPFTMNIAGTTVRGNAATLAGGGTFAMVFQTLID